VAKALKAAVSWVLVVLGGGCASTPVYEMEPMHFRVVDTAGVKRVEALDPEALFEEGNRAFQAERFEEAAEKYGLVVDRFPQSRWHQVATFNSGLALEKAGKCDQAIARFSSFSTEVTGSKDAQDALFRIAACYEQLKQWPSMLEIAQELLRPHFRGINVSDRLAATVVRGRANEGLEELALAERDYRSALDLYQANLEDRGLGKSPYVSVAQFRIGELYRELFASIRFKLPLERMARDLEDKSNFFLMAQSAYLRAIRLQHNEWAVVAGFNLGALYETMYEDMLAAEVPDTLTEEEVGIYFEELHAKIRPLLTRAIDIYERNLRLGQRMGKRDAWMQKTEASLARLKDVLRAQASRAAEGELRPVTESN
jgi:tetratricopeptide (TPR) repeat protein